MAAGHLLLLNRGSSSLKFSLNAPDGRRVLRGLIDALHSRPRLSWQYAGASHEQMRPASDESFLLSAIWSLLAGADLAGGIVAMVHRVVHGGGRSMPVRLDAAVITELSALAPLAPLHNPPALALVNASVSAWPVLPQYAVFDTALHAQLPERAWHYAVPDAWTALGVRRYGFHGLSHAHVAVEAARCLNLPVQDCALVSAHLGQGASVCALLGGLSVDTSMGMTPLEGLVMGTRSGDLDPGLLGFMAQQTGADIQQLLHTLNHESGLQALSGVGADMRDIVAAADAGSTRAQFAIELFCYRLAKAVAAMVVALGRPPQALVFTGGIGEHQPRVRERVVQLLAPLGFLLEPGANALQGAASQGFVHQPPGLPVLVIASDEEAVMARQVAALLP